MSFEDCNVYCDEHIFILEKELFDMIFEDFNIL